MRVFEHGGGRGVDARTVVDEIASVVRRYDGVEGVARVEELHAAAIQIGAVKVHEIGIFAILAAAGGKGDGAGLFINRLDVFGDEFAVGDLVLQFAFES